MIIPCSKIQIDDLIGKPFRYNGRGPAYYDCIGLVLEVYKRLHHPLSDYYTPDTVEAKHQAIMANACDFQKLETPQPYAIATFMVHPPYTTHCGVVLPNCCEFLHILWGCKTVIERLDSLYWKNRITGFYYPKDTIWKN